MAGSTPVKEGTFAFFATEIFLSNNKTSTYQKRVFSIQDEESRILSLMKLEDRNFLLKCINDVVISSVNLKDFEYYKEILHMIDETG